MKKSFFDVVQDQYKPIPEVVRCDLSGQTIVVVGANTGLGLEATKHFATMNPARIIIGCRNLEKGKAAINNIENDTGYKNVEAWLIDLSSFSSVADFVDRFEKDGGRLDLLVANAGIADPDYKVTSDGWESTLQVNHLSTALLCLLLIPTISRTATQHSTTPRMVVTSSDVHYFTKVQKEALDEPRILEKYSDQSYCSPTVMKDRYQFSKLLNVFFVRALSAKLGPTTPVIVDAVNPGYCYSELRRNYSLIKSYISRLMDYLLAFTSEEGSRQLVYAAIGGTADVMRGAYISRSQVAEVSDYALSEEGKQAQERIWAETLLILSDVCPKVRTVADEHLSEKITSL